MADLLEGLESGLRFAVGASSRLRCLVERIDQFIITNKSASTSRRQSPFGSQPQGAFEGAAQQAFRPSPIHIPGGLSPVDTGHPQQAFDQLSPSDAQLPFEMLQDWSWPFEPDNATLFPDILSGWAH